MTTRDRRLKRKIERARRVLGTKTNRETIERALDTVLAEEQVRRALRRAGGSGGIEDVFGHADAADFEAIRALRCFSLQVVPAAA